MENQGGTQQMSPNWMLYLGIFFACTGFLLPVGAVMIALWFYNDYTSKYMKQVGDFNKNQYSPDTIQQGI